MIEARPFVKWAGGKSQLLEKLVEFAPEKFENYFEPFLGGGALFFKLHALKKIKKSYLNDVNEELTNAYRAVKESPSELIEELGSGKYRNDEETFYKIRAKETANKVERAARFIYLNKTAFNGLYRVNLQNKFNVPFGKYDNPKILDKENILAVNKALQTDEITCVDFEYAVEKAGKNDFVYFDPPYQPVSKTAKFTNYTSTGFGENDQVRLFKAFKKLGRKGCFVMLSNSYSEIIKELYSEFEATAILASRMINCKAEGRGKIKELLITNYPLQSRQSKIAAGNLVKEVVATD